MNNYELNRNDGSIEDNSMPTGPNDPEAKKQAARVEEEIAEFEEPAAGTKPPTDENADLAQL